MSTPLEPPDVTVVVAFYNRRAEVASCIGALLGQQFRRPRRVEIVAVDNGSTDGTLEELRQLPIRVLECKRRGPAAARNMGIENAQGAIVAMTDSDCVPDIWWLDQLLEPFDEVGIVGAGGRIDALRVDKGVALFAERAAILNQGKLFDGVFCFPPFFATANAAYRREMLNCVRGFDETLKVGEDADLTWRILDLGGKIAYCNDAVISHGHRETFSEFFRQAIQYGGGAADVFAKHRERFGLRSNIEWENVTALAILPFQAAGRMMMAKSSIGRKWGVYEALWRTGFTIGRIQSSIRNRVWFI
jgi:cellulose synthase/poly-beta-1,6-N-acetylglucosamine synthase-like glycosyltransferase